MKPIISLVAAATENNVIGRGNAMPWHLPADLQYFKRLTLDHFILMGRRTFEAIGKPLPRRTTVIITKNKDFSYTGCYTAESLEAAVALAQDEEEVFVAGGGSIYRQALPLAGRIYLTRIHTQLDGDTFFPAIDPARWALVHSDFCRADAKNPYDLSFLRYHRK